MNKHAEAEPFFITEDVEADLRAAGYVFEPPKHVSTLRLSDVLTRLSNADLATWQGQIAERERAKRQGSRD